jgi:hypothetical protein
MDKLIETVIKTPLPTILVLAGIVFLFLAVGGQLGARFSTERLKPLYAFALGLVLVAIGTGMFWMQIIQNRSMPAAAGSDKEKAGNPSPSTTIAPEQETYALRGPSRKGTVTRTTYKYEVPDVALTIEENGGYTTGSAKLLNESTWRTEVIAVEDGHPLVLRKKIESDSRSMTLTIEGATNTNAKKGPLEGATLLLELKNGRWVKTLVGGEPTEAQKEELEQPFVGSEELYPIEKIAPGHTWQVKDQQLASLYPNALQISGNAWCKFERVELHQNEKCVVISRRLQVAYKKLVGRRLTEYNEGTNSMTYRALNTFYDVETTSEGNLTIKYTHVLGGKKQTVEIAGPFQSVSYVTDITSQH